ncbi:uncharacterized protein LOC117170050 [Belonocnema kinseyi]|uniref:uncharacterized protein LOC117170050 n=1 Tax=Belonocnema kinseyi TaxID=2817044 RepID=UPI00143CEA87|nr:uncharacterized protein LOC117170050 [Belonocnema kinseyi]
MRNYITDYVKEYQMCERYKPSNSKPAGILRTPTANRRFEVLAIDLFGPLPLTAEGLLRFGTPRRVISEKGVQFVEAVMQQVAFCLGFNQALTAVYNPESNPVERKNSDMKTQIAILVEGQHRDWAKKLPSIRYARNTSFNQTTGHAPSFLTFARELRTADNVQGDQREIVIGENFVSEVAPYLMKIADVMKDVREVHENEQDKRTKYANQKRSDVSEHKVWDLIMVRSRVISKAAKGTTQKYERKRDGTYKTIEKNLSTVYKIGNPDSNEFITSSHTDDLTRFKGPAEGAVPAPGNQIRRRGRSKKMNTDQQKPNTGSSTRTSNRSIGGACNSRKRGR